MVKTIRLSLGRVIAKLKDFSLLDPLDIALLRFVYERYGREAPLGEINAVVVLSALAPRWREMLSIPSVQPYVPSELFTALTANLAEKELNNRLMKLESLGLIEIHRDDTQKDKGKLLLTELGKVLAVQGGIPLDSVDALRGILELLQEPIPPSENYVIPPNQRVIAISREMVRLRENELCILQVEEPLSRLGVFIANNLVWGPYNDHLELIIVNTAIPIVLRSGSYIAKAVVMPTT